MTCVVQTQTCGTLQLDTMTGFESQKHSARTKAAARYIVISIFVLFCLQDANIMLFEINVFFQTRHRQLRLLDCQMTSRTFPCPGSPEVFFLVCPVTTALGITHVTCTPVTQYSQPGPAKYGLGKYRPPSSNMHPHSS
jgi:hypothetical protein